MYLITPLTPFPYENLRHFCDASPLPRASSLNLRAAGRCVSPGQAPSARVSGCPPHSRAARRDREVRGVRERRQTPQEMREKEASYTHHCRFCKKMQVYTHTPSDRGENYTRLTPPLLSKHQHRGWMAQWLDPTKDLARRLARRASCPVAGRAPPTHQPHEGRGGSGKAKGERMYAG